MSKSSKQGKKGSNEKRPIKGVMSCDLSSEKSAGFNIAKFISKSEPEPKREDMVGYLLSV